MFLADDAPHSFRLFHESNGDEDVIATPWGDGGDDGDGGDRTERTVTFQTKISPGSSSNPLSQSERGAAGGGGGASVIPLGVAIRQTLVRRPDTWVLECEFAFDFHSHGSAAAASAACPASSPSGGHATTNGNNGSVGGVGKRFGTGLLGQYFMSNVVKGTTVNVAIILRECDDAAAAGEDDDDGRRATAMAAAESSPGGGVAAGPRSFLPDGILSCLVHPLLLLPPDGLCASRASVVGRGDDADAMMLSRDDEMRGDGGVVGAAGCEPSRIGASLLSAIKARNAPCCGCGDLDGIAAPPDASLVGTPLVVDGDRSGAAAAATPRRRSDSTGAERRPGGQSHHRGEDVLRCSSIGALRSKRNASFDLSRTPSTIAMRRTILEKDTPSSAVATNDSRGADYIPAQQRASSSSRHPPLSSSSTPPRGLSMRIEMELGSSGNNNLSMSSNSSSLSSTFSRSTSMSTIDDKIRRGLRKRVARSWISWAESWCMRLWEDDDAERARRRKASSGTTRPDHRPDRRGRANVNVRPTVRRIGDPAHARKERDGSSSVSSSSSRSAKSASSSPATTTQDVWTKLHPGGDHAHRRVERWMSISEREGECGVEVACRMLTRRPSPAGVDHPPERRYRRPSGRRKRFWGNLSVTP
jgi:hypothetical protein